MRTADVKRGAVAGLFAGAAFGILLQITSGASPAGNRVAILEQIAQLAGSTTLFAGWLYHFFDSAVMGAIFGAVLGERVRNGREGLKNGLYFGLFWWILGGIILMPFFLAMSVFAPRTVSPALPVGIHSLFGHVVFGVLLGGAYAALLGKFRGRGEIRETAKEGLERMRKRAG